MATFAGKAFHSEMMWEKKKQTSLASINLITNDLDWVSYIAGTTAGHFRYRTGTAQCEVKLEKE